VANHFSVEPHTEGRDCVLDVRGELDLAAASSLDAAIERTLQTDAKRIVLDLTGLDFIDSTGLSVLVRAQQRAQESGCELGVINAGPQVERLLSLTGLWDRLALSDD
jgi:anti-sigma B factor antagonist